MSEQKDCASQQRSPTSGSATSTLTEGRGRSGARPRRAPGGLVDKGTKGKRARTVPLIVGLRELVGQPRCGRHDLRQHRSDLDGGRRRTAPRSSQDRWPRFDHHNPSAPGFGSIELAGDSLSTHLSAQRRPVGPASVRSH